MVEKLNKDMIEAMKAGEKEKLTVIRMVKAALKQEEIDHKKEVNDDLLIDGYEVGSIINENRTTHLATSHLDLARQVYEEIDQEKGREK